MNIKLKSWPFAFFTTIVLLSSCNGGYYLVEQYYTNFAEFLEQINELNNIVVEEPSKVFEIDGDSLKDINYVIQGILKAGDEDKKNMSNKGYYCRSQNSLNETITIEYEKYDSYDKSSLSWNDSGLVSFVSNDDLSNCKGYKLVDASSIVVLKISFVRQELDNQILDSETSPVLEYLFTCF